MAKQTKKLLSFFVKAAKDAKYAAKKIWIVIKILAVFPFMALGAMLYATE